MTTIAVKEQLGQDIVSWKQKWYFKFRFEVWIQSTTEEYSQSFIENAKILLLPDLVQQETNLFY